MKMLAEIYCLCIVLIPVAEAIMLSTFGIVELVAILMDKFCVCGMVVAVVRPPTLF